MSCSSRCCSVWLLLHLLPHTFVHALHPPGPKAVWLSATRWARCSFHPRATILEGSPSKATVSSFCPPFSTLCCSSSVSDLGPTSAWLGMYEFDEGHHAESIGWSFIWLILSCPILSIFRVKLSPGPDFLDGLWSSSPCPAQMSTSLFIPSLT